MAGRDEAQGPGEPGPDEVRAAIQEVYAASIEDCRRSAEAGDGEALLRAMLDACLSGQAMPDWLANEVAGAIRRYTHMHVKTLDEAFRVPPRTHFISESRRRRNGKRIFFDICLLRSAGVPITQDLFHAVGELHGLGRNVAQECYSAELKRHGGIRAFRTRAPEVLPQRLWGTYFRMTGKQLNNRL
jgi:hypothetical protein